VPLLNWLETQRGQCFSEEIGEKNGLCTSGDSEGSGRSS